MKISCVFAIFLALNLTAAPGSEVEARLIQFAGDVPTTDELIRLNRFGLLPTSLSCVARTNHDGAFKHKASKAIKVPVEFDRNGKLLKTVTRDVGFSFGGHARSANGTYRVTFRLEVTEQGSPFISRTEQGTAIAQPQLRTRSVESRVELPPNIWAAVRFNDPAKDLQQVLLVRVRQ